MTIKVINIIEIYNSMIFINLIFVNYITTFYIIKFSRKSEQCFLF